MTSYGPIPQQSAALPISVTLKIRKTGVGILRRLGTIACAVVISGSVLSACGPPDQTRISGQGSPEISSDLDSVVLAYLDGNNVPGVTVAVTKDSRLVLSKGYGVADVETEEQMQPWHRTRIGSVSKVPTAIGLLQLVEKNMVDLQGHVYSSWATPLWDPDDAEAPPGIVSAPDGLLENSGEYLTALTEAVKLLAPAEGPVGGLVDVTEADDPETLPAYLTQDNYQENVEEVLDWATSIRLWHLLTHTSGHLDSSDGGEVAIALDKEEADLTYPELHRATMAGVVDTPLRFKAADKRDYSNHGFSLTGQIIAEVSNSPYVDHMEAHIFGPLGLDVVPGDLSHSDLNASSHTLKDLKPEVHKTPLVPAPKLGTATGGWLATAQDLGRVMCGLDSNSNNLRLLEHGTVDLMAQTWYGSTTPLGWDRKSSSGRFTKDGNHPSGGGAKITKFLPGSIPGTESDAEINVAVAGNLNKVPPTKLLENIATHVARADIPAGYDLFADKPCFVPIGLSEPPYNPPPSQSVEELVIPEPTAAPTTGSLINSKPTPEPSPPERLASPTPRPTPMTEPTTTTTRPRSGPCAGQAGPLAVAPDSINLAAGRYSGTFSIHHCASQGTKWTITRPPSVSTSADSGTLEGGASQPINLTVDPNKLGAGPFRLVVEVATAGQTIDVEINGNKPARSGSAATGSGSGAEEFGTGSGGITPGDSSP